MNRREVDVVTDNKGKAEVLNVNARHLRAQKVIKIVIRD